MASSSSAVAAGGGAPSTGGGGGGRFFANPFPDYGGGPVVKNDDHIRSLVQSYVNLVVDNTRDDRNTDHRGDLYVGDAGIAYMFLRLHECGLFGPDALQLLAIYCLLFIRQAYVDYLQFSYILDIISIVQIFS
uniref:LanC-like protein 3 homolog n=2 Tax=Culex pipiens TaxID=7175 RepID=A0A8D8IBK4_CULPI